MALTVLMLAGLAVVALLVGHPLWRSHRRWCQRQQPLPSAWRRIVRRRVPQVARLPADLQLRLKGLMQVFLAEKAFIGCAGLAVTDEMRVTVAAQACLPLLGHPRGYYPKLRQVLLYPGAFVVNRPFNAPGGVVQDQRRALLGESWGEGQVILSWQDVLHGAAVPDDGRNVVVHEFAHQLDQVKGLANGAPWMPQAADRARWARVLQAEYDALQHRLASGRSLDDAPDLLDPYAATDPAEFFAVASEVFFEQGAAMAVRHPALYAVLQDFYGVDSASWAP